VNNVHYVEWMLEADAQGRVPPASSSPAELDIVFRQAAQAGESLASEFCSGGGKRLHAIRRRSDGALLATAATVPFAASGDEPTAVREE